MDDLFSIGGGQAVYVDDFLSGGGKAVKWDDLFKWWRPRSGLDDIF